MLLPQGTCLRFVKDSINQERDECIARSKASAQEKERATESVLLRSLEADIAALRVGDLSAVFDSYWRCGAHLFCTLLSPTPDQRSHETTLALEKKKIAAAHSVHVQHVTEFFQRKLVRAVWVFCTRRFTSHTVWTLTAPFLVLRTMQLVLLQGHSMRKCKNFECLPHPQRPKFAPSSPARTC